MSNLPTDDQKHYWAMAILDGMQAEYVPAWARKLFIDMAMLIIKIESTKRDCGKGDCAGCMLNKFWSDHDERMCTVVWFFADDIIEKLLEDARDNNG